MRLSLLSPLLLSVLLHAALLLGTPPLAVPAGASLAVPLPTRRYIDARLVVSPRPASSAATLQGAASALPLATGPAGLPLPGTAAPVAAVAGERRAQRAETKLVSKPRRLPATSMPRRDIGVVGDVGDVGDVAADSATQAATVDAGELRQYRWALAIAARRWWNYPAQASERGWQGTATVALDFGAKWPAPRVVLLRSSGNALLDAQALEMIARAAAATVLPEALRARDWRVVLPVEFSLEQAP